MWIVFIEVLRILWKCPACDGMTWMVLSSTDTVGALGLPKLPKSSLTLPLRSNGSFPGAGRQISSPVSIMLPELSLTGTTCSCLWVYLGSLGLQGTKQLIWDQHVRRMGRKGVSVTFHGGMWQCGTVVLQCQRGKEIQVWELQSGSWNFRWDRGGTDSFMAWEGTEVWGRSPESALWEGFLEGLRSCLRKFLVRLRESPACEERDRGQTHLGLCDSKGHRRLSAWGAFLLRMQPGGISEHEERTQHRVCCLCQLPSLGQCKRYEDVVLPALQLGSHAKQRYLGLMQGPFEFWQFSFCDLKLVFTRFLSGFVRAANPV